MITVEIGNIFISISSYIKIVWCFSFVCIEMAGERLAAKGYGRSEEAADSAIRFLAEYPEIGENLNEKKALDFHESDPAFRIFVCRYPVAPVFVVLSGVKLVLLMAALFTTIAQLAMVMANDEISNYSNYSTTPFPSYTTPKSVASSGKQRYTGRTSWASAIFYFEPSWWFSLAYLRLTMAIVAIFSVLFGLFGMWRQKRPFILATAAVDCGLLLFLLGYMVLLAWHAVKYDDYFAFAIGGLAVLSLLLISVMCLHAAIVTHRYLRSMLAFLHVAKNRWPDAYDEAVHTVRRRSEHERGLMVIYDRFTQPYAVAGEIMRIKSTELTVFNRRGPVLHDIEEADGEDGGERMET